ncbi:23443_t:CDS:2, partial [Racocetra persica]
LFDARLLTTHGSINAFNHLIGVLRECILNATPTETHKFIKKLADMEKLKRVYTQNIDNLEELVRLYVDWQFEKVKNNKAQQDKVPKCTKYEERENVWIKQEKYPNTIGQLNPTIVLYGDSYPKGLKINQITVQNQHKADCLIIIGLL